MVHTVWTISFYSISVTCCKYTASLKDEPSAIWNWILGQFHKFERILLTYKIFKNALFSNDRKWPDTVIKRNFRKFLEKWLKDKKKWVFEWKSCLIKEKPIYIPRDRNRCMDKDRSISKECRLNVMFRINS